MFSLDGKTALVTGASGGIGAEIARAMHSQGARVVLSGTRVEPLEALAQELAGALVVPSNLGEPDAPAQLLANSETALGKGVDIVVNNAGITRDMLAMRLKDEDWDAVVNVNLTASFKLAKAALRGMMRQKWGRIIGISSVVGITGNPGQANYAASKAGMIGYTKALAREVASRGITVNTVAPGYIDTAMTDFLSDADREKLTAAIPCGYTGKPSDVAAAVIYLASQEASYVTGQTLSVNGGMAML